jgi:hypothetical protein
MKAPARGDVHFHLENEDAAGHAIVVPGLFRKVEAEVLAHPDHLGIYRLNLAVPKLADVSVERRDKGSTHAGEIEAFVEARTRLFHAITEQHMSRAADEGNAERFGIVETTDLLALENLVRIYLNRYLSLVASSLSKSELTLLAELDVVELRWTASHTDPGRGLLLAPTHPVRIAWHFQHMRQLGRAIRVWQDRTETVADFRELLRQYRHDVQPTHAPPVMFDSRGRGYVEQGPITSHWSLYLPDAGSNGVAIDVAASRDRVRACIGLRGGSAILPSIGFRDLAVRLFEYVQLHPYVEQLHINVFNPGDGELIADVLRELEKLRHTISIEPPLRYVVRLLSLTFVTSGSRRKRPLVYLSSCCGFSQPASTPENSSTNLSFSMKLTSTSPRATSLDK